MEEIKEQKDIDNMTIKKMSDSAKSTPEANDQSDDEEMKSKNRSPSLSSKTTSLEESQRFVHYITRAYLVGVQRVHPYFETLFYVTSEF